MGFSGHSSGRTGNRNANRLRLAVPASLVFTHETRPCLIDDISATGARLRVDRTLTANLALILVFHELRLFSSVMWSNDGECGLRFDKPIEREDMEGLLWIRENRAIYDRICQSGHAIDWTMGRGE